MTQCSPIEPIRRSVTVRRSPAEAFRLFTAEIDTWWPLASHSVSEGRARSCVFEGRLGGTVHEIADDGTIHVWGTVTAWEPPSRVVFSWHPGRDAVTAQEVEVRFTGVDAGTRVEVEHRRWETLGEDAVRIRDGYVAGWPPVITCYVACCEE